MPRQQQLLTTLKDKVDPKHCALLLVDMQTDFCHRDGFFPQHGGNLGEVEPMYPQLRNLLEKARAAGVKVYVIRATFNTTSMGQPMLERNLRRGWTDFGCKEGSWGAEQYEGFYPTGDEPIITKHVYSAFIGTDLDNSLHRAGIKSIIVTGVLTNVCVECTVRDGFQLGFYPIVPQDCVASYDKAAHQASLTAIKTFFGTVSSSEQIINTWESP